MVQDGSTCRCSLKFVDALLTVYNQYHIIAYFCTSRHILSIDRLTTLAEISVEKWIGSSCRCRPMHVCRMCGWALMLWPSQPTYWSPSSTIEYLFLLPHYSNKCCSAISLVAVVCACTVLLYKYVHCRCVCLFCALPSAFTVGNAFDDRVHSWLYILLYMGSAPGY